MSDYFSDRRNGPHVRTEQVISPTVWAGLVATVQALISSGAFGLRFPERCPDGQATCGGDAGALAASVSAEMQGLVWPLETVSIDGERYCAKRQPFAPDTLLVLPQKAGSCSPIPFRNLFGAAGFAALERTENLFDAEKY